MTFAPIIEQLRQSEMDSLLIDFAIAVLQFLQWIIDLVAVAGIF